MGLVRGTEVPTHIERGSESQMDVMLTPHSQRLRSEVDRPLCFQPQNWPQQAHSNGTGLQELAQSPVCGLDNKSAWLAGTL